MATTKRKTAKKAGKKATGKAGGKYSFVNHVHESVLGAAKVSSRGEVKLQRSAVKAAIEGAFEAGAKAAARGERIRFPVIGALLRKDVPARKSGKGTNPFTGQEMMIKARPESKKPRWSFPRSLKEVFSNKRNWK
jgi:nucleoid DNA-binding protein